MRTGLPNRPSVSFPSQDRIDSFRANRSGNSHLAPYGPKPPGKRPPPSFFGPPPDKDDHNLLRKIREDRISEQRAVAAKKKQLADRIAAVPPPTYTPIAPKPVLLNFEKLTFTDLIRIFTPKFEATLRRLEVFETLELDDLTRSRYGKDLEALIARIQHLKRALSDTARVRTAAEFQGWNYGLQAIGKISFKGLRKNTAKIVQALSAVYKANYFEHD